ncbi:MAG: hypothetical protein ABIJ34_00620 [archaeon]
MEKKTITISGIIAVIILIVVIIKITTPKQSEPVYFTEDPSDWISDNRNSEHQKDITIDINRATKTLSIFDGKKQEYYYYGKRVTFFSHGYYQGIPFTEAYVDPDILQDASSPSELLELADKNAKIKISQNMNPNDGIMNAFILAKVENKEFVFYLFVDEDWKNQIGFTNIMWGDNLKDINNVKVRSFDFEKFDKGIYYDKITDAVWFKKDTNGGIFLGEITKTDLGLKSEKDLNATFIYVQ